MRENRREISKGLPLLDVQGETRKMNYKDVATLLAIAVMSFMFGQQLQIWFIPSRETEYSCFKWTVTRQPAYICIEPGSPYFRCDITNQYCLNYMPFAEGTMGYVGG